MTQTPSANLDLLRAIAVILVLVQHVLRRIGVEQLAWIPTSSLGRFGVLLFFVHTCLVLMWSMQRSRLSGWSLLKNFHARRIFRIYPLSILTVLTALVLHLNSGINGIAGLSNGPFPGKRVAIANLLLVQNLASSQSIVNVLWSLPFELQMYIFLPFIFLLIRRKRPFWPLMALWTVATVVGTLQIRTFHFRALSILQFTPNFLPGVIAFVLPHKPRLRSILWPVAICGLIGAYTLHPTDMMGWMTCLILGFSIPFFAEITNTFVRWASNRIATYSYGIYLSHQFCIWIAFGVLTAYSGWVKVPTLIVLLISIPIILYHTIEKPMIHVGVHLANSCAGVSHHNTKTDLTAPATERPPTG